MSPDGRIYRFGPFEADPRTGELRKHGIGIRLREQPFQILLLLLERPGEVVLREDIRARLWPGDVVVDFDHGINTAVQRLRDALSETAAQPRYVETVGRRGYRFIAPVTAPMDGAPKPAAPNAPGGRPYRKLVWVAVALLAAAAGGVGFWLARHRSTLPPPRLVRLTAFTGTETMPTFSPDGKQVAFVWNGEKEDNNDIYVKMVGSPALLRLTSDAADDILPAWAPDGRQIAFVSTRGQTGIYLVSPLGGPERKLADLPMETRPSWSADGKFLAAVKSYHEPPAPGDGAVFLVPVEAGGPARAILVPPPGMWYRHPAFSPDSRTLAVAVCTSTVAYPLCQLQIVSLNRELLPQGAPRTIVSEWLPFGGLAWMPDGGSLVVSALRSPQTIARLWRVFAVQPAEPEPIELAGERALWPAVSPQGNLAFARLTVHSDIWRWQRGGKPSPFLTSTVRNNSPQFTADGRRIAFQSGRSGDETGIWTANADGTGLVEITQSLTLLSGSPRWSPDGHWIAFDQRGKNGWWDVWKVEVGGGPPRQLTEGPANTNNGMPSWSRDGKRVYFWSKRSGSSEIWCVPSEGGAAQRITHHGGHVGVESSDGKTLYYTKSDSGTDGIFALPLAGGEQKQVITDQVARRGFAVFAEGIYYLCPAGKNLFEIRLHELASGRNRPIREIEGPLSLGFAVSPDQNTFLFSKVTTGGDLMLIENFR